jgi:hypothetical protein
LLSWTIIAAKVLGLCDNEIGGSEVSNSNGNSINSIVGGSKARIRRALYNMQVMMHDMNLGITSFLGGRFVMKKSLGGRFVIC